MRLVSEATMPNSKSVFCIPDAQPPAEFIACGDFNALVVYCFHIGAGTNSFVSLAILNASSNFID